MEAVAEVKVNIEDLKKNLQIGIANANNSENSAPNSGDQNLSSDAPKLVVVIPNVAARFVCDWKNSLIVKHIGKDMDEDDKAFIRDFFKATPEEIEIYRKVLGIIVTEMTPEEYKANLNKWLLNPSILAAEMLMELELKRLADFRRNWAVREKQKVAA